MTPGSLLFAVCAVVSLAGAMTLLVARSPIRGAMGLLATIVGIAGLFLQLKAEFLAAIQLIVYAGAVVVLFVFVVMLLGSTDRGDEAPAKEQKLRWLGAALVVLFAAAAFLLAPDITLVQFPRLAAREFGSAKALGDGIFRGAMVPFEVTTALLVAAAVGALAVARTKLPQRLRLQGKGATGRMFGGPVHPRDLAAASHEGSEQ